MGGGHGRTPLDGIIAGRGGTGHHSRQCHVHGLRRIADPCFRAALPVERQRAGGSGRKAQLERLARIDFRVAKEFVVFGRSCRKAQADLMALGIDQLEGMAIDVVAIGDVPSGRERIALLLRRVQLENFGNVQKLPFTAAPGGKKAIRPRAADRTTTQEKDRYDAPMKSQIRILQAKLPGSCDDPIKRN